MTPDGRRELEQSLASGHRSGSTIGPYQVLGVLGSGSFGIVYRVSRVPDETLALKLLIASDPEDALRFTREIEIARRLDHPGLVRIVDAGRQGTFPYYVMEYCPGETLAARLNRAPYDIEAAARLVLELARTTAAVNREGVIHRDLKPSNVILGPDRPRITDFGLAHDARARERLTRTGDAMGTPAYMAPELFADAKRSDQRADVYALGVILYQCLTGVIPFQGAVNEVARRVVAGRFAPPRSIRADIPDALEAVVLQAMARDPADRYATADVLVEELERALTAPPPSPSSSRPLKIALAATGALAVALLVGIGVVAANKSDAPAPETLRAAVTPTASPEATPEPAPDPTPSHAAAGSAKATLAEARRLAAKLGDPKHALALFRRAQREANGDPRLEAAALRGELDVLFGRGRVSELRARAAALGGSAVDRYARFLVARTHPARSPARRSGLEALTRGSDAVSCVSAGILAIDRPEQATPLFRRALEIDPDLAAARVYLALIAARAGRTAEAHRLLDEVQRRAPNDHQALWARIQLLQYERRSQDAIVPLDRLIALRDPKAGDRYDALYQRARMALHVGKLRDGIPFLDQALAIRPRDTIAYLLRGVLHLRLNDRAPAARDFRSAALANGLRPFERALQRRYRSPQLQTAIWSLTFQALRKYSITLTEGARRHVRHFARPCPEAVRPRVQRLLLQAAMGARWPTLEAGWDEVRAAAPGSGWVALLHARALLATGWITKCTKVLEATSALTERGNLRLFKYRLLADAARHAGNHAQARRLWRLLAQHDPEGDEGRLARAWLTGYPDAIDRSVPALQEALKQSPDHGPTILALTAIQATRGHDPLAAITNVETLLGGGACSVEALGARFRALSRLLRAKGRWDAIRADAKTLLAYAPHSSYLGRTVWWVLQSSPHAADRAQAEAIRKRLPLPPKRQ